jgi:hypothetical protein
MDADDADSRPVDPWIWRRAIRTHAPRHAGFRLTLLMIATYMNRRGVAWPSQKALAEACCCNIRTIRRHVDRASRAGWLIVRETRIHELLPDQRRKRGQWRAHVYQASVPAELELDELEAEIAAAVEADSDAPDHADTPSINSDSFARSSALRTTGEAR